MARAYSQDLRDRVIDAALGGLPARRAAAQFRIGLATAKLFVAEGARVLIVNEELARHYFGSADPVGQRVHFGDAGSTNPWMTVVGVVGNERLDGESAAAQ